MSGPSGASGMVEPSAVGLALRRCTRYARPNGRDENPRRDEHQNKRRTHSDQRSGDRGVGHGPNRASDADDGEETFALLFGVCLGGEAPELRDGHGIEDPTHRKNGTPSGTPRVPSAQKTPRFIAKKRVTNEMSVMRTTRAESHP